MTVDEQQCPCLLCQSSTHQVIVSYEQPDSYEKAVGVSVQGYFRKWVQCLECGFYFSVYSRPAEAIDKIYRSAYRTQGSAWRKASTEEIFRKVIALPDQESETKFRVRWIKERIARLRASGIVVLNGSVHSFLDVGGGTGVFAYEFQDDQWRAHIVDPSHEGQFVQRDYGIPYISDYYKPNVFGKKFDLITSIFILEHLRDPQDLLKKVYADLADQSFFYVEVPDCLAFQLKPLDDDIFNSCHLWMFSANTLTRLLGDCGFEVLSLERVITKRGHLAIMALTTKQRNAQ